MEYAQKLKDPRWQKKRLDILNRDNFCCQKCWDDKTTLHVHHIKYLKGKEPWDIDDKYLVTLCENCHETEGEDYKMAMEELKFYIEQNSYISNDIYELITIIKGFGTEFKGYIYADILIHILTTPELLEQADKIYCNHIKKLADGKKVH